MRVDLASRVAAHLFEEANVAGQVALGRLVMHQRERLVALEPRDKGIIASSLRTNREVKNPAAVHSAKDSFVPDV